MNNKIFAGLGILAALYFSVTIGSGCAQIGAPTGGPRDTLAPVLVKADPEMKALQFSGNKIVLTFDEYVEVQDVQNNVLVSPYQKNNPSVNYSLRTVTVRLKDSLLPNTTYSIKFGNAIRDINESNVLRDFNYVFSTGNRIDTLSISGKVLMAETGLADSTLQALLYRNTNDSAVRKLKPDYIARLKGDGSFTFTNLPEGNFRLYALKDADGSKNYSVKTELFAFLNTAIPTTGTNTDTVLYAYAEEKPRDVKNIRVLRQPLEKKLQFKTNFVGGQDLLTDLELTFNNPLKDLDTNVIVLTDTNYNRIANSRIVLDSTRKIITYQTNWQPATPYRIIVTPQALDDSAGNRLAKADTLKFTTKAEADYGRITIRFNNFVAGSNPVLQFIRGEDVAYSYPLNGPEWTNKRFPPGEYQLRILYDDNKDGVFTPGNYTDKRQPEKAVSLPQKLSIRADWDNERDINL